MSLAPILEINPHYPQPHHVQKAVEVLRGDGVIAYPTDTNYGIGCAIFSKKGIDRLYQLKDRDRKKPFSFLCSDLSDVAKYGLVSNFAYRTMKQFTPGPFTFILTATRTVPEMMHNRQRQVGIRVPNAPFILAVAAELGRPIVTTSAINPKVGEALVDARSIKEVLGNRIDFILDGGIQPNEPSTVISLIGDEITLIRQGKGILS
ncbi:MAG: L-threonylcarbamoyladenylate synthase [Cystobacterineae bacterium]|nr:L-threonylcarbamoyladenylate synthase [Cystobacterineae bacterium]